MTATSSRVSLALGVTLALAILAFTTDTAEPAQGKWSVILLIGSVCLVVSAWQKINVLALACLALLGWACLSLYWSADWRNGFVTLLHAGALLGIAFQAGRVAHVAPPLLAWSMIGSGVIWYLGPEWLFGGFGNRNFAAEFMLMAAPFALLHKWLRWPALIAGAYVLFDNHGALKWLGLAGALGALAFYPAWKRGDWFPAITASLAALAAVVFFAWPGKLAESLSARLELLLNSLAMIADRPIWGWGLGSFNAVYPDYAERHRQVLGDWTVLENPTRFAGSAHNEFAQLHVELGLVGWVLALSALAILFVHFRGKTKDWLDWAAFWSLAIGCLLALIAFPFQNPATALVAVLSIGLIARGMTSWAVPRIPVGVAAMSCAGAILWALPLQHMSSMHYGMAVRISHSHPEMSLMADLKAIETWPYLRGPRHQLMLLMTGLMERRGLKIDDATADRWYRISKSAAGNDPAVLLSRLRYLAEKGRDRDAEARAIIAHLIERHALQPGIGALAQFR